MIVNVLVLSVSVCRQLRRCVRLICHQVKQPEVWSNFLCVMEVITALAHCSDWSLLVTMGWCDFWGRVSGNRLSNQVRFRRRDMFNHSHSNYTLQFGRWGILEQLWVMTITDVHIQNTVLCAHMTSVGVNGVNEHVHIKTSYYYQQFKIISMLSLTYMWK